VIEIDCTTLLRIRPMVFPAGPVATRQVLTGMASNKTAAAYCAPQVALADPQDVTPAQVVVVMSTEFPVARNPDAADALTVVPEEH
jgi:hypothetical protein